MKLQTSNTMQLTRLIIVILILTMVQTTYAGPWACAACITTTAAGCIVTCAPLIAPQLVLACSLECEIAAAYGPCLAICGAPTP